MEMSEDVKECPKCHARSCHDCLKGFNEYGNKCNNDEMNRGTFMCSQCHAKQTMMGTNKLMLRLLKEAFRIDCNDCMRHWSFDEYK